MAFINLKFYSPSLQMQTEVNVIIPQRENLKKPIEDCKCLYLLHGLGDDFSTWARRTAIERYAEDYGICVIMPSGGRSFYFNQSNGENYYDFIAKELPSRIDEFFKISAKRENMFIAGVSMGGYGALKIALKECDTFCAGAGLSSVANIKTELFKEHLNNLLSSDKKTLNENDLYYLIKEKEKISNKPRLYAWCGTSDFLYQDNVAFKNYMKEFDYDFTYNETEGTHDWNYWDKQIICVLDWMFNG